MPSFYMLVHPDDREKVEQKINETLHNKETIDYDAEYVPYRSTEKLHG